MNRMRSSSAVVLHLLLVLGAIVALFPFYEMIVDSFKSNAAIYTTHPSLFVNRWQWGNYYILFHQIPFALNFLASAIASTSGTFIVIIVDSMAAYAFGIYRFRGQNLLFVLALSTMMMPLQVLLVPLFVEMRTFRWINTYQALVVPWVFNGFGVFLLRQYMIGAIPLELVDAARVEGASGFTIYWRIVVPLIRTGLVALGTITFMYVWNDFLWPTVVLSDVHMYTIPVALSILNGDVRGEILYGSVFAGSVIGTVPLLIIFIFGQRYFVSGMTMGAVKN